MAFLNFSQSKSGVNKMIQYAPVARQDTKCERSGFLILVLKMKHV